MSEFGDGLHAVTNLVNMLKALNRSYKDERRELVSYLDAIVSQARNMIEAYYAFQTVKSRHKNEKEIAIALVQVEERSSILIQHLKSKCAVVIAAENSLESEGRAYSSFIFRRLSFRSLLESLSTLVHALICEVHCSFAGSTCVHGPQYQEKLLAGYASCVARKSPSYIDNLRWLRDKTTLKPAVEILWEKIWDEKCPLHEQLIFLRGVVIIDAMKEANFLSREAHVNTTTGALETVMLQGGFSIDRFLQELMRLTGFSKSNLLRIAQTAFEPEKA